MPDGPSVLTFSKEMGTIGIVSSKGGEVLEMDVFQLFFETIETAVIAGAEEIRIISQKPLGHAEVSVQFLDKEEWHELKPHPELNSWITHSRLRIVMRMDIADQREAGLQQQSLALPEGSHAS